MMLVSKEAEDDIKSILNVSGAKNSANNHQDSSKYFSSSLGEGQGSIESQGRVMSRIWEQLTQQIEQGNNTQLYLSLDEYKQIRLTQVRDERGFSLLHHSALKQKHEAIRILIEYARDRQEEDEDILSDWINSKTLKEKLSALHLASFKGCLNSIRTLLEFGADIRAENAHGMNMLHIAAQGDSANSLYFFKTKKLDLNKKDFKGSTPLHWACFSQSEVAISYLVAWKGVDINAQDNEGFTPLHLAVKSAESVNSSRAVRYLLIAGAKTNVRDNVGNRAIELAQSVDIIDLRFELISMLKGPSKLNCFMIKPPLRRVSKHPCTMLWMLFIFLAVYAAQILFIFPRILDELIIATFSLTFLTLLCLLVTNCKDPGYITNRVDFMELLDHFDATQLCPECQTLRTVRSRHCNVCHRCVERFDHHCPWINNCVGVYNHNWFLAYLTSQYLLLGVTIANCVVSIFSADLVLGKLAQIFDIGQPWQHEELQIYADCQVVQQLILLDSIWSYSILQWTILYTYELALLCSNHQLKTNNFVIVLIMLYLKGMTTNERFGRGANRHDSEYNEENIEQLHKLKRLSIQFFEFFLIKNAKIHLQARVKNFINFQQFSNNFYIKFGYSVFLKIGLFLGTES